MSWVKLQRQRDAGSCVKSPWSDRSQWPAHCHVRANSTPAEQRWFSWMGNKCLFCHCRPARQRLRQCHPSTSVLLQQCKEDQIDPPCLFTLGSPRKEHQEISALTSAPSTGHTTLRNFLLGAFLQSGLKNHQGFQAISSNTLLSSKVGGFFLFISSLKLPFQPVPVTAQPHTTSPCAEPGSSPHKHRGCCQVPWSLSFSRLVKPWSLSLWSHRASVLGTDPCAGSHSRFLCFNPPGPAGPCQEMCFPGSQTPPWISQTSTPKSVFDTLGQG